MLGSSLVAAQLAVSLEGPAHDVSLDDRLQSKHVVCTWKKNIFLM
jgi:hypothetical protein